MEEKKKSKKNRAFAIVLSVIIVGGGIFGVAKFIHSLHHEETEDAQVETDISPIIPRVSGYVERLFVEDNKVVKEGDTLIVLDDRDLQVKIKQSEASLENAIANLAAVEASAGTAKENVLTAESGTESATASIEVAQVRMRRAEQDFKRYEELIKTKSVTQQQFEQAEAERDAAAKQLEVAKRTKETAMRQTSSQKAQRNVSEENIALARTVVKEREADLHLAQLQASYTVITAPFSGIISKKSVQPGQFVQAGQSLFALVSANQKWIIANFKETQLDKMRPGQDVEIKVDAFSGQIFLGKVESLSPATGSRFALLPADNASGNFVKVIQRVPVKIILTESPDKAELLRAGMNVQVDVHVN